MACEMAQKQWLDQLCLMLALTCFSPIFIFQLLFFVTISDPQCVFLVFSRSWFLMLWLRISIFLKNFIYLLLERGEGRKKEKGRNINVWEMHGSVAPHTPPAGDLACNPGMCPDWESNQQTFSSQASAQSTEPHHQPGHHLSVYMSVCPLSFYPSVSL